MESDTVASPPGTPDAGEARPIAVIVDGQLANRRSIRNLLQEHGWEVFETEGWMRGLTMVGLRDPELIVLDPDLPDGDGIAFIRDVRAWSRAVLLVLAGRPDETVRIQALEAGASGYLAKPIDGGELMAQVARHRREAPPCSTPAEPRYGAAAPRREQRRPARAPGNAARAAPLWLAALRRVRAGYSRINKPVAMPPPLRLILLVLLLVVLSAPMLVRAGQAERSYVPAGGAAGEPSAGVAIRVLPGGWGTAHEGDIARVLTLVAGVLAPAFPRHAGDSIEVAYSAAGPHAMFERRPDGAYRIYLSARDTRWDQFAYQFSHEYCHVVTNVEQRAHQDAALRGTQWFEEAMCEAVSLLVLERVAARWQAAPPRPGWDGYAGAFHDYARQLAGQAHRRLPAGTPLENWFAANQAALQFDPYRRDQTELAASALYAWLRNSDDALEAIGYLGVAGLGEPGGDLQFAAYLERWRINSPERLRNTVMRVSALFGIGSPAAPRAQLAGR